MTRRLRGALVALTGSACVIAGMLTAATPAAAVSAPQSSVVSAKPALYTPDVNNGVVYAIGQVGSTVFLGGSFTSVSPHKSSTSYSDNYIAAFTAGTGDLHQGFAPTLNGQVNAIIPGPTSGTVYVGGNFTTVDGVKSRVALLDTSTGALAAGWTSPKVDGQVTSLATANGQLFVAGYFDAVGGSVRDGLATLNATTGSLTSYSTLAFTGHHNYTGGAGQAKAGVGVKSIDVNPTGTRLVAIGNFTSVSGSARDQIAVLDLAAKTAVVDAAWATDAYTATCFNWAFDSYVRDVQFSPDGSYFVVVATGGSGTNTDGTNSSCDSATRFDTSVTGADVRPTWTDYTGQDTLWTVAVTDAAIYVGGHERWLNNSRGYDYAGAGATPRPGIAALDPVNGVPLAWNPGRNPRGAGAYALLATRDGLYVGSDTEWIGNYVYHRKRVAFFPLAGGYVPPANTTGTLPGNVYLLGAAADSSDARAVHWDGSSAPGSPSTISGVDWSGTHGAFEVNGEVYYASGSSLYRRSFDGRTFGAAVAVDPYDDPAWSDVKTGSGQTYRGAAPTFYSELPSVTSMFYDAGRVYYTLAGHSQLFWRWFETDSGITGSDEFTAGGGQDWSQVAGAFLVRGTVYYADPTTHDLSAIAFSDGQATGPAAVVDSSLDWSSQGAFVLSSADVNNTPPTASFTATCSTSSTACSVDAGGSADADGHITGYDWAWGDGTTTQAVATTQSHTYAKPGKYTVTLTVTDNDGGTGTIAHALRAGVPDAAPVTFVGASSSDGNATSAKVTVPASAGAGDTLLLFESIGSTSVTATPPSGWTLVGSTTKSNLATAVFQRAAQSGDAGSAVTVHFSATVKASLTLADYANAAATVEAHAAGTATSTTQHTSPAVNGLSDGSLAVTFWADKSTGTTAYSLPADVTQRSASYGAGAGAVSGVVADSGAAVSGSYGGEVATTNVASGSAATWTIALAQGG